MRHLRTALGLASIALVAAGCATRVEAPAPLPLETHVLRFDTPAALDAWTVTGGEWRVEDGRLRARSLDPSGASCEHAILGTHFAEIERVVLRGGLEADAKQNFRFAVGAVGVILNWEVRPQNIVHHGYRQSSFGPYALTPGRETEIVLERVERRIRLVIDDRLLWEDTGTLSGTITLSATFRTQMTIREIEVRGRAAPGVTPTWPSAPAP